MLSAVLFFLLFSYLTIFLGHGLRLQATKKPGVAMGFAVDEIGKRFLTVDVVVIPVHFSSFLLLLNAERELKYTHRLNLHSYEYKPGVRAGVLAKLLGKDKGNLVDCYGSTYRRIC